MIKKATVEGDLHGVIVCRRGPKILHLFFADDSLIFCRASLEECDSLQRIFQVYEAASGQQLNRTKTSLFFNSNTDRSVKEEIKNRFGAQVIKNHRNILVFRGWLAEINETHLIQLRRNLLRNCQVGRRSCCQR